MRQRLGIAAALLGDPRVLILDEPANGLDPAGIRWMRDLLTDFAGRGGTVLLSSHLLHEIEVIADDLVVIGGGRIVASGTKEELLAAAGTLARSAAPRELATRWSWPDCPARSPATARCAPTPTPPRSGPWPWPPASPSPSSAPPRAPGSRTCSSPSPPPPNAKESRHERHDRHPHHHDRPGGRAGPQAGAPGRDQAGSW